MAKSDHGKKAQSSGVGESRIFAKEQPGLDWDKLTVNGQPIPEAMRSLMPYEMTDQGVAEKKARQPVGVPGPRVEVLRDQDDKRVDQYRDDLEYGDLINTDDPLKIMMDKHLPAHHRGLWMGDQKMRESGLVRGRVEYKPVLVDDGTGKMVQVRQNGMLLTSIPETLARKNDDFFRGVARDREQSSQEQVLEQTDRIVADGKMRRMAKRDTGALEGLQVEHGEDGDMDLVNAFPDLVEEMAHES